MACRCRRCKENDPYPYNPEWHKQGVDDAWDLLGACPPRPAGGRVLPADPYEIARHHGADEATASQLAELLRADWSGMSVLWIERLRDLDGWCYRDQHRGFSFLRSEIPDYLDPERVAHMICGRLRSLDPFDPDTMAWEAFKAAADAGGEFVMTNIKTGEEAMRFDIPGSRPGAAPLN